MNFNIVDLNKIFYYQIRSLSFHTRYGFEYSGNWDDPEHNKYFGVSLDSKNVGVFHWLRNCYYFDRSYRLKSHSYFYKIDHNHFLPWKRDCVLYFLISDEKAKASLRELILFMIYMKHLYSCI